MLTYDSITVSEKAQVIVMPSLYQSDLGLESGTTYFLSVDSEITSGVLEIYQGTQLLYSSSIVYIGEVDSLYEDVKVIDDIEMFLRTYVSASPSNSHSVSPSPSS